MDNKVKITLATTGVLLVLIIATGLYSTFNPKLIKSDSSQNINKQSVNSQGSRAGLGLTAKTNVKSNAYYFPETRVKRAKVDPQGNSKVSEGENDNFSEIEIIPEPIDIAADFPEDYVQAPEDALLNDQSEIDQQPQDQVQDF